MHSLQQAKTQTFGAERYSPVITEDATAEKPMTMEPRTSLFVHAPKDEWYLSVNAASVKAPVPCDDVTMLDSTSDVQEMKQALKQILADSAARKEEVQHLQASVSLLLSASAICAPRTTSNLPATTMASQEQENGRVAPSVNNTIEQPGASLNRSPVVLVSPRPMPPSVENEAMGSRGGMCCAMSCNENRGSSTSQDSETQEYSI